MKGIQVYDKDLEKWIWCVGYVGLSDAVAKEKIKMLRSWAREDDSGVKYRLREGEITPA